MRGAVERVYLVGTVVGVLFAFAAPTVTSSNAPSNVRRGAQTVTLTVSWSGLTGATNRAIVVDLLDTSWNWYTGSSQQIGTTLSGSRNVTVSYDTNRLSPNILYQFNLLVLNSADYERDPNNAWKNAIVNKLYPFSLSSGSPSGNTTGSGDITAMEFCGMSRTIAITIDDGPAVEWDATRNVLREIQDNHPDVKVTFFVSPAAWGETEMTSRCNLVTDIMNAGHEVQCHSWNHVDFDDTYSDDPDSMVDDLKRTNDWIKSCSPTKTYTPTLMRPPYGNLNPDLAKVVSSLGLKISFWNVDTQDWDYLSWDEDEVDQADIDEMLDAMEPFLPDAASSRSVLLLCHDRNIFRGNALVQLISRLKTQLPNHKFIKASECWNTCSSRGANLCDDPGYEYDQFGEYKDA